MRFSYRNFWCNLILQSQTKKILNPPIIQNVTSLTDCFLDNALTYLTQIKLRITSTNFSFNECVWDPVNHLAEMVFHAKLENISLNYFFIISVGFPVKIVQICFKCITWMTELHHILKNFTKLDRIIFTSSL